MLVVSKRDNFTARTKNLLARRVGFKCSAPSCRVATVGPTDEPGGSSNVGEAAHITAAGVGGPRYDASLTSAKRMASANGIWLCSIHAKQIDDDPARFSVEMLGDWKAL